MENVESEYPTDEQMKEVWTALQSGNKQAVFEVLHKREKERQDAEDAEIRGPNNPAVVDTPVETPVPRKNGVAGTAVKAGTLVFGAFSAITLLVAFGKGIPPIYLLEAALWLGAAWYWQAKNTHSEVAKGIVTILAIIVAVGDVVQMASQGGERFRPVRGAANLRFDTKTAQNCWAGGPGERLWDRGSVWQTTKPPHIATCASLKGGEDLVTADSIFTDIDQPR